MRPPFPNPISDAMILGATGTGELDRDMIGRLGQSLRGVPVGAVYEMGEEGSFVGCDVAGHLALLIAGTLDKDLACRAADIVAAGCVVAYEIMTANPVSAVTQKKLHKNLTAFVLARG